MIITPFLALKLRTKRDAVLARQRARRVASLLCFDPHEQACIAAGTFVVACQALAVFGKSRLCFQIEHNQLQVFAEEMRPATGEPIDQVSQRLSGLLNDGERKSLFRLCKPMPPQETATEQLDLAWLVHKVEETADDSLFDEIVKQNQETLALLHELRLYRGELVKKEEKLPPPHAA